MNFIIPILKYVLIVAAPGGFGDRRRSINEIAATINSHLAKERKETFHILMPDSPLFRNIRIELNKKVSTDLTLLTECDFLSEVDFSNRYKKFVELNNSLCEASGDCVIIITNPISAASYACLLAQHYKLPNNFAESGIGLHRFPICVYKIWLRRNKAEILLNEESSFSLRKFRSKEV
jgi:hypothetical protein